MPLYRRVGEVIYPYIGALEGLYTPLYRSVGGAIYPYIRELEGLYTRIK